MKMLRTIVITVIFVFVVTGRLLAAPGISEILGKMDDLERLGTDITCKVTLIETKANQGTKVFEGISSRRDQDDAYLLAITVSAKDKGHGYLRVDNTMWMYRRNTRTFLVMDRGQSIEVTNVKAS